MGFFSSSETKEAPNRSKREQCWESRDIYFACLDKIQVSNPFQPDNVTKINKNCYKEDQKFQKDCVASWVKYFKEKRPFDLKKERMLREAKEQNAEVIPLPGVRPST
ncbi:hypothetical protein B5S28_g870 [[Candida] boidinii]|nr:hypothetical protein B5S28_g870 [[Candida] boidinii]OWB60153.1 hypothetical protein B5S29_g1021 [[Candida] boidinii]OWB71338.1 hypothetical protein B5S31_g1024 [[Candida] boidinii]OWB76961.1 hypothetical protein B5S32_g1118 [[Candida] boidinii]GME93129.1 unnamed protein product [[Candida] boidinii]